MSATDRDVRRRLGLDSGLHPGLVHGDGSSDVAIDGTVSSWSDEDPVVSFRPDEHGDRSSWFRRGSDSSDTAPGFREVSEDTEFPAIGTRGFFIACPPPGLRRANPDRP